MIITMMHIGFFLGIIIMHCGNPVFSQMFMEEPRFLLVFEHCWNMWGVLLVSQAEDSSAEGLRRRQGQQCCEPLARGQGCQGPGTRHGVAGLGIFDLVEETTKPMGIFPG